MQLLCEFRDVYSQHQYDLGIVDIPFHITLKPDAELKKATHQKNSNTLQQKNTNNP